MHSVPLWATRWPVLLATLIALVVVPRLPAQAQQQHEHRLEGADWTITIPAGWRVASQPELDAVNAAARSMVQQSGVSPPDYVLELVPETLNGRYVLVQRLDSISPGLAFSDVAQRVAAALQPATDELTRQIGVSALGAGFEADRERHRVRARSVIRAAGGQSLCSFSEMCYARKELIVVHAYAPASDFDDALPELRDIAGSVRFDEGAEYVFADEGHPASSPQEGASQERPVTARAIVVGVLAVGLVIALAAWLASRRAQRRAKVRSKLPAGD